MTPNLPIIAAIEQSRAADFARLQRRAASGFKGSVAARLQMQKMREQDLKRAV